MKSSGIVIFAFLVPFPGYAQQPDGPRPGQPLPANTPTTLAPATLEKHPNRGYVNNVNRLFERSLKVKDDQNKPAVRASDRRPMPDVELKIVWTSPDQFGWNYCLPELHGGKDLFHTDYASTPLFLEKKLGAKTSLEVSVPDTPYSFYLINGRASGFFYDSEKSVIWELKSEELEKEFHVMRSISATSKRIVFEAPGGDCAEFLIVDFSDRDSSPKVQCYMRYDGP